MGLFASVLTEDATSRHVHVTDIRCPSEPKAKLMRVLSRGRDPTSKTAKEVTNISDGGQKPGTLASEAQTCGMAAASPPQPWLQVAAGSFIPPLYR